MLKRAMLYLMLLMTAGRFGTMVYLFVSDSAHLPTAVYLSTGLVIFLGTFLTARFILGTVKQKELCAFFVVQIAAILFNLIYMKLFTFMELHPLDFLVIGTLVEVVAGIILLIMNIRESRYIDVTTTSKPQ